MRPGISGGTHPDMLSKEFQVRFDWMMYPARLLIYSPIARMETAFISGSMLVINSRQLSQNSCDPCAYIEDDVRWPPTGPALWTRDDSSMAFVFVLRGRTRGNSLVTIEMATATARAAIRAILSAAGGWVARGRHHTPTRDHNIIVA